MITALYSLNTVMCLVVLYYSVKLWREQRDATTFLIFLALSLLWLDNFAIASGRFFGEGPVMTVMTYTRYYMHWQVLPVLLIVAGAFLRRSGFAFAKNKIVMGVFCTVAVFLMILDVPYIFQVEFYPACYGETLRIVTNVPVSQVCDPANPPPPGISVAPIPAISICLTMIAVGIALWMRHGFKWLALCSLFMFVAAGTSQLPEFYLGQWFGNFGEPIFNVGIIAAAYRFPPPQRSEENGQLAGIQAEA